MSVRDFLKPVGRKPRAFYWGESAECSTVYHNGIPRGFVSSFDREAWMTRDSSRHVSAQQDYSNTISSRSACCFSDECADCSAGYHPTYRAAVKLALEASKKEFSTMNNLLMDVWAEIQTERIEAIKRARQVFLMALHDPNYTSPQTYALQSVQK
jgi:hypothetical protein